jgi:hypothetical protein
MFYCQSLGNSISNFCMLLLFVWWVEVTFVCQRMGDEEICFYEFCCCTTKFYESFVENIFGWFLFLLSLSINTHRTFQHRYWLYFHYHKKFSSKIMMMIRNGKNMFEKSYFMDLNYFCQNLRLKKVEMKQKS